jgi:hypothetical protein
MRFEPPPYFSNKKVTAKAIAIALAFSFAGTRQVVAGVTAGALVLGPSLVNAFGSQNPISPALCGQAPPKNTPIISSPAKPFSGASRRQKLLRTGLFYVKDPATGANNLQVANPNTGVVVTIDGKGNLLRINDPSKAPRAQSPPLNKANATRAGPQAQNLDSVTHPVKLSEDVKASVIQKAQRWQGQGEYPGVDNYRVIVLKKGTRVYGGEPGQTEFYTTAKTLEKYGNDSRSIYGALQVKPKNDLFRPGLTEYLLKEDTVVAVGITRANPQWGVGGATQIYIEKFKDVLQPTKTFLLKNRKAQ